MSRNQHFTMGEPLDGLREDDAMIRLEGLREDDAKIHLNGLREDDARIMLEGLREDDAMIRLDGLREDDAKIRMGGLREDDARIMLNGLREDDARILLEGLREEDAKIELMGLRESDANIMLERAPGMAGFHLPDGVSIGEVEIEKRGAHRKYTIRKIQSPVLYREMKARERFKHLERRPGHHRRMNGVGEVRIDGFFDFLRKLPSDEEYLAAIRVVLQGWDQTKPRLMALSEQSRSAIVGNMTAAKADPGRYESLRGYLDQGAGVKTLGRWDRVNRLRTYLPTLANLISQTEALGPAPTPKQEQQRAADTVIKDVALREQAAAKGDVLVDTILPVAAGAAGAGVIALVVAAIV